MSSYTHCRFRSAIGPGRRSAGWGALLVAGVASAALGQQLPKPPPSAMPEDLPMPTTLYDAQRFAARSPLAVADLIEAMRQRGVTMRDDRRVEVEIVGRRGSAAVGADTLARFGGEVVGTWRHRSHVWIPVDKLDAVARSLPKGYTIEQPHFRLDDVDGEGPAKVNSAGYRDGGADGDGLVIAIIDMQFSNLTSARTNGDAPPTSRTTQINYAGGTFESGGNHGTGCVEAAYDHCPGATWRLYKISTTTDLGNAVDDAIDNDVDIISHSISWYNVGWNDNDGDACDAANAAADTAILFFTSAGNAANQHWQGNFKSGSGDADWHDWNNDGDETNNITITPGETATIYLSWDTSGDTYNYDLYLYDTDLNSTLASSTRSGENYESCTWTNGGSSNKTAHLAVYRSSGGATEFEVFVGIATTPQYNTVTGSTTSPSNSTSANVISVGAVSVTDADGDGTSDYDEPAGHSPLRSYSSRGPSNDGMTLPDISGPTDTSGFVYGTNGFGGTSAATPNVAGACCAFRSSQLYLNTYPNGWLMRAQAEIYKDWGTTGNDDLYGYGGARLINFHGNTYWVSRAYGNTIDDPDLPFYTVAAAQAAVPAGGRIVFVYGGSYPEPVTLNKDVRYETIGNTATLGD